MVIIDNILYLGYRNDNNEPELLQWFTDIFLKDAVKRSYFDFIQHPRDNRKVLVSYDSIPEATRTAKGMPSKEQLLKEIREQELARLVKFNDDAYNYFLTQPAANKKAKEKAEQVSWLIAIASTKTSHVKALGFTDKDEFCLAAIRLMNARKWQSFSFKGLPGFRKRLKPFQQYLKGTCTLAQACDSIISKKTGNTNASKIGFDQQALLVQLFSDANAKPNYEQTWMIYTRKAKEMVSLGHWDEDVVISPSTVRAFLDKPAIRQLWYEARHGYQAYRNVFESITQRERPSFANALWVIDGTPSHRYFQHGEKGRYFRFNIFPILDAHSWCVVGFWLSEAENTDAVLGALRSACWISGYMPHQILYDNSSAIQSYRAQEAIEKISVVSFAATAGNARSKIIENFFHLFNQDVQKFRPGYTANPFAVRIDNRPNREALALMVKSNELPLAEHAIQQAVEDLTIWNNTPRKFLGGLSPLTTYRNSVSTSAEKQRSFSEAIDIDAFYTLPGEHKKIRTYDEGKQKTVNTFIPQQYEFTNRGIDIVIAGKSQTYNIEDAGFRKLYTGQKFTVRYEPNTERWIEGQPEKLLLYMNGTPLQWNGAHASLSPTERFHMAVVDYRPGERGELNEHLTRKKVQRSMVQQDFKELIEHTKRTGTYTPVITANAFDKDVLNETKANMLDQFIKGEDYRLTDGPTDEADEQDETPTAMPDRLSKYDKPLPLN